MYTKEQASKLRQQFWTKFGQYMKPVPNTNGEAVNWLNYKTAKKGISFHMDADKQKATIAIEIKHTDDEERKGCYQQFVLLKTLLENETGYKWNWQEDIQTEYGQVISSISQEINNVNVLNENDWPAIIAFFKPRILSLDSFWELAKDGFD